MDIEESLENFVIFYRKAYKEFRALGLTKEEAKEEVEDLIEDLITIGEDMKTAKEIIRDKIYEISASKIIKKFEARAG